MADSKSSATAMDTEKSGAAASSNSGKHGEKKDESFLTKTAHSIRDKVHGFTGEVKDKAQHLRHGRDSKESKKTTNQKKTADVKLETFPGRDRKESDSDDDDKSKPSSTMPLSVKKEVGSTADKSYSVKSESPPSSSDSGTKTAMTETAVVGPSMSSSHKPFLCDPPRRLSNDKTKPTIVSHSAKPSGTTVTFKEPEAENLDSPPPSCKSKFAKDSNKKASSEKHSGDHVHISIDGVDTVDDLLNRINEAIEQANIIVEGGNGKIGLSIDQNQRAPIHFQVDQDQTVDNRTQGDDQDEPIRVIYNDIHTIDDVLIKINNQPGNRKVLLENASANSASNAIANENNSSSAMSSTSSSDNEHSPTVPKSILKNSRDPSYLNASIKTSSFEDDKIHVNIEDVNAVQSAAVIIDTKPHEGKKQAPQRPISNDTDQSVPTATSGRTEKREAPKAPSASPAQPSEIKTDNTSPSSTRTNDKRDNAEQENIVWI